MNIHVQGNRFGHYTISNDADDRMIYVQDDWDFPGIATAFGWTTAHADQEGQPCPGAGETDGTVSCPACSRRPGWFIGAAAVYLDSEPGPVEDPGYFDREAGAV